MGTCSSQSSLSSDQLAKRLKTARTTRSLALKGIGLKSIPPDVLELGPRLRTLDLSGNPKIDLAGLERLTDLRKLVLSGCKLVSLPPLDALTSLEELSAAHNGLTHIPSVPPSLERLDASRNSLEAVPEAVERCPSLQVLNLSDNPGLALTASVGSLGRLRELGVANCGLESLGGAVDWSRCAALESVDAGGNAISITSATVPTALLVDTALSKLILSGNPGASQRALMALSGFDAFAARRKGRLDKLIAGGFSNDHDILSG